MTVETDADRLDFLRDWHTGVFKGTEEIYCIFDDEYIFISGESGVESTSPAAMCRTSDVSDAAHGMTFRHDGADYTIRGVQPDGTGFTLLKLEQT